MQGIAVQRYRMRQPVHRSADVRLHEAPCHCTLASMGHCGWRWGVCFADKHLFVVRLQWMNAVGLASDCVTRHETEAKALRGYVDISRQSIVANHPQDRCVHDLKSYQTANTRNKENKETASEGLTPSARGFLLGCGYCDS